MAHDINVVNGKAACFSLRENPWHGLGQVVECPVTDDEAIRLAGLDWNVDLAPICRSDMSEIVSHVATVRSDTRETLGVVGSGYCPVQNRDLFTWLRGLDGFADVTIETAGALGSGETVWVQARCEGLNFDLGDGGYKGYMLMSNGHAGNRRMIIMPTMQRVICRNTLRAADGGKAGSTNKGTLSTGWALRHTLNVADAMKAIQDAYIRTTNGWKASEDALRFLASKEITDAKLDRLFVEPWLKPKAAAAEGDVVVDESKNESVQAELIRTERTKRLNEILASGTCNVATLGDTLYAALQACTEYVDHESTVRTRKGGNAALARLESSNFGGVGDDVKARAWKLALELAEIA